MDLRLVKYWNLSFIDKVNYRKREEFFRLKNNSFIFTNKAIEKRHVFLIF